MTGAEATQVLARLSAGYPHVEWADDTDSLWLELLEDVGFAEGMKAATATIQTHPFLSAAAFFGELAVIRERHADEYARNRPPLIALSSSSTTPPGEAAARVAQLKEHLAKMQRRDKSFLGEAC